MKKLVVTALTLSLCLVGFTAGSSPGSAEGEDVVLSRGHLDAFDVTFDPGTGLPRVLVKDDTELFADGVVFRDPATVTIDADRLRAAFEVPEGLGPEYAFLGEPGEVIYLIPEVQDPELPWPGWSTERLESTTPAGTTLSATADAVKLSLEVSGPGDVHTFMSGSFGEVINHYVDTTDAVADVLPAGTNNHVHTTWLFTEVGDYTISVTPSVTTTEGVLVGEEVDYHFHIGDPLAPIVPQPLSPGPVVIGTPTVGSQLAGSDGVWKPQPTEYVARQWQRDGVDIPGAGQSEYVVQAADAGHQLTFRTTVRIGRETASATSAPVSVPAPVVQPGAALRPTVKPRLLGVAKVGRTLRVTTARWTPAATSVSYRWRVGGKLVRARTGRSLQVLRSYRGKRVTVVVTARRPGHAPGSVRLVSSRVR